jgi:hypothetical protein
VTSDQIKEFVGKPGDASEARASVLSWEESPKTPKVLGTSMVVSQSTTTDITE